MEFKRIVNLDLAGSKGLFLFGPRQTGKSYWLRKMFPKVMYYDLLQSDLFFSLSHSPHRLREEVLARSAPLVIIDEIQKLPVILDEVHYLMERHKVKFILTGSSARKLKRGGANLLGGRALYQSLFPLTSHEIPGYDVHRMMQYGTLPAIYKSQRAKHLLQAYVRTYLKEEIQAEGLVRHLQPFSIFLDLAGQTNTQLINYSNIANDVGVSSHTIKEYYHILEDTFIGYLLPPYKKTVRKKALSMSKFYFFDMGVVNALTGRWAITPGTSEFGRAFEHFIFHEINSCLKYRQDDRPFCFWRSKNHQEVDFIIGDDAAIEVKAVEEVRERDLKGLKTLCQEVPFRHKIVVCFAKRERLINNEFLILPYKKFLKRLWADRFM